MRCYNCGHELPEGAKVCLSCGKRVGERQSEGGVQHHTGKPEKRKEGKGVGRITIPSFFYMLVFLVVLLLFVLLYFYRE